MRRERRCHIWNLAICVIWGFLWGALGHRSADRHSWARRPLGRGAGRDFAHRFEFEYVCAVLFGRGCSSGAARLGAAARYTVVAVQLPWTSFKATSLVMARLPVCGCIRRRCAPLRRPRLRVVLGSSARRASPRVMVLPLTVVPPSAVSLVCMQWLSCRGLCALRNGCCFASR